VGTAVAFGARRYMKLAAATVKKMEDEKKASFNISFKDLSYGRLIGRGNFGEGSFIFLAIFIIYLLLDLVYIGEYRGTQVAIKKLMNQQMSSVGMQQFTSEVAMMVNLRHPNILLFMGACAGKYNFHMNVFLGFLIFFE
jgi:sterile alpha motif and leucine zipper-containing kinase AZK